MIGIPLRICYNHEEYIYYILSPPGKKRRSCEILLECKTHLLFLDEQEVWTEGNKGADGKLESGLIQILGKAISQHYSIKKRRL